MAVSTKPFSTMESSSPPLRRESFLAHQQQASNAISTITITAPTLATIPAPPRMRLRYCPGYNTPRLVNLLGFCVDSKNDKLLVIEYMPNGSLYDLLQSSSRSAPGWSQRIRFAVQIGKAVQALHSSNLPVIHRDIKSSVLIDENWNARLGDFGLAVDMWKPYEYRAQRVHEIA